MGLFKRDKASSVSPPARLQVPDELARDAQLKYGNAEFAAAAELYSQAVDKLHTMYAIGGCKYRQPSSADSPITEGLVSAVGAALAMNPGAGVRSLAEKSIGYLGEIAELPQAQPAAEVYRSAISGLSREIS